MPSALGAPVLIPGQSGDARPYSGYYQVLRPAARRRGVQGRFSIAQTHFREAEQENERLKQQVELTRQENAKLKKEISLVS